MLSCGVSPSLGREVEGGDILSCYKVRVMMFVSGLKAVTSESIQANQEKQGCAGTELTTQRCWNSAIFPWAWNRSGSRSLLFVWVDVSSRVYPINEPFIEYFLKIGPMWGLLAVNCQKKDLLCVLRCGCWWGSSAAAALPCALCDAGCLQ